MSKQLRRYLLDEYEGRRISPYMQKIDNTFPIQIDDQDDSDNINEFCNVFCTVSQNDLFTIEICGNFPITDAITDLVEIYNGGVDRAQGRLTLELRSSQVEAIMDLADRIRKTATMGKLVANSSWLSVSARTISSLYRFVRIIKDFNQSKMTRHILVN